jgi:hypothetical protein
MRFAPGKLFHAVVISGAALTGCAGPQKPTTAKNESKAGGEATTAPQPDKAEQTKQCPPGSELPYPPCFLIL